jgi:hypothetical protein
MGLGDRQAIGLVKISNRVQQRVGGEPDLGTNMCNLFNEMRM